MLSEVYILILSLHPVQFWDPLDGHIKGLVNTWESRTPTGPSVHSQE